MIVLFHAKFFTESRTQTIANAIRFLIGHWRAAAALLDHASTSETPAKGENYR